MAKGSMDDAGGESETPDITPMRRTPLVSHPDNDYRGMEKEPTSQNKPAPKDFLSSVKEIEYLFIKASESGNVVPRMLEANKVHHHRPIFPETKGQSSFLFLVYMWSCRKLSFLSKYTVELYTEPTSCTHASQFL